MGGDALPSPPPHQGGTLVSYYCLSFKFLTGGPSSSSLQSSCSGSSLPFPCTPSSAHPLPLRPFAQLTLGRKTEVLGPVLPAGIPALGLLSKLSSRLVSSFCPQVYHSWAQQEERKPGLQRKAGPEILILKGFHERGDGSRSFSCLQASQDPQPMNVHYCLTYCPQRRIAVEQGGSGPLWRRTRKNKCKASQEGPAALLLLPCLSLTG